MLFLNKQNAAELNILNPGTVDLQISKNLGNSGSPSPPQSSNQRVEKQDRPEKTLPS